jgi:hypothetical protein
VENRVTLAEGDSKSVELAFVTEHPAAPEPPPAPTLERAPEPQSHAARTWGFVALSVGVAGLATGVTAGVLMLDAKSTLDRECGAGCPPSAESEISRFRTTRILSGVGYGVGALGIGAGALLLLLAPRHAVDHASHDVHVFAGYKTVGVEGSF